MNTFAFVYWDYFFIVFYFILLLGLGHCDEKSFIFRTPMTKRKSVSVSLLFYPFFGTMEIGFYAQTIASRRFIIHVSSFCPTVTYTAEN